MILNLNFANILTVQKDIMALFFNFSPINGLNLTSLKLK